MDLARLKIQLHWTRSLPTWTKTWSNSMRKRSLSSLWWVSLIDLNWKSFFLFKETQCIAEELIDEAIHGALEEMYADLAEKLRLDKIEASKNEISCENLIKPSELIKRQRSARSKTEKPSVQIKNDQAVNKDNERQIEQHDAVEHDRLSDPTVRESLDENSNKEKHGKSK